MLDEEGDDEQSDEGGGVKLRFLNGLLLVQHVGQTLAICCQALFHRQGADVSPPERLPGMGACSPLAATEGVPKRHVCKPGVHDWLRQAN